MFWESGQVFVTTNKTSLIKTLKINRGKHIEKFTEAWKGYVTKLAEGCKVLQQKIEANKVFDDDVDNLLSLDVPASHVEDYDRIIGLLEASIDENATLTESMFARYAQDDWDWRVRFDTVYANYSSSR